MISDFFVHEFKNTIFLSSLFSFFLVNLSFRSVIRIQYLLLMGWIFSTCQDLYGLCIRQYSFFGLSIILFFISLYSTIMTIKKQVQFSFETIPLIINTISTVGLVISFSQFQQQNIHIIMGVIEIYSYSLLAYSYIGLYLLSSMKISVNQFRKIKIAFIVFSIFTVLTIVALIILQINGLIKCNESHGIGNLILSLLEVPLYIITFIFVAKTKQHIKILEERNKNASSAQLKLLQGEDEYIKIRYYQANTVVIFFSLSIFLHIVTVIMFFVEKTNCSDLGYLQIDNLYELTMFSLFDLATLLPHVAIPIILYFISSSNFTAGETIVINNNTNAKFSEFNREIFASHFGNEGINNMLNRNKQK